MSKYGKIFDCEEFSEVELNEREGIAAIVTIAALADDVRELVAPDLYLDILGDFELYEGYSEEDLLSLVDRLTVVAMDEGLGALFNAADEAIPDESVLDAYEAAVLVYFDIKTGEVPVAKQDFLKELQAALDIDDEEVAEIMVDLQQRLHQLTVENG
jgi:hypothetical protein